MKSLILTISFLLIATTAWAAGPYLVCDPMDAKQVTSFSLQFDGGDWVATPAVATTGGVYIHYDLSGLTDGNHTVVAKAVNEYWGESKPSDPFVFTKGVPEAPGTLGFSIK